MTSIRWAPSVTVAAIIERDGRFLMVEEEASGRRVINQPAGHWEPDETLIAACSREALEETGHAFTPSELVGIYVRHATGEGKTYLRFAFCGACGDALPGAQLDTGIVRALWMTPSELHAARDRHRSPFVMRGVRDYLDGRRYPLSLVQHED